MSAWPALLIAYHDSRWFRNARLEAGSKRSEAGILNLWVMAKAPAIRWEHGVKPAVNFSDGSVFGQHGRAEAPFIYLSF